MYIQLLKQQPPLYYNLKKWSSKNYPVLAVTGLAGSGKTTFAQKFAQKHDAIFVSFDVLKFYSDASEESQKILKIFLKEHPDIKKLIHIHWTKTDVNFHNDILYNYYCNIFFDFLVEYGLKNHQRIVLEGIQFFVRLHPSKSINLPIIIIRNSCMKSLINKIKRDYPVNYAHKKKSVTFIYLIKDIYLYHIKQCFILNKYINYLSAIYNQIKDGEE